MKFALLKLLSAPMAAAFAPPTTFRLSTTKLSAVDPSALHDLSHHHVAAADSINHFFSSMLLSDLDVDAVANTIPLDAAPGAATDAAAAAATTDNGWFGFLTGPIEGLLKLIHGILTSVGLSEDAWGVSIIAMTILIKVLTFPLTKSQLESTNKMQVRSHCNL
jgi:YidC/Oxa1 family membrane protein insertase